MNQNQEREKKMFSVFQITPIFKFFVVYNAGKKNEPRKKNGCQSVCK